MAIPNDPQIGNQWHLLAVHMYGTAAGNPSVWDDYTGQGIQIGVYDNGVQGGHADLDANYNAALEYTGTLAAPNANGVQHHGTTVAGIIAAEANGTDTVGVAYNADITGVRIYDIPSNSEQFYREVFEHQAVFDVVNHSWGSSAHGWGPAGNFYQAIRDGMAFAAAEGRFGLGTNVVVTSGNDRDGQQEDLVDANGDGMPDNNGQDADANIITPHSNDRHAITVAAAGQDQFVADYSNPGACLLITAPSKGTWDGAAGGIVATDKADNATAGYQRFDDGWTLGTVATNLQGTSFAAPIVTGVIALMLEANPLLGWRDVKEILASTAVHLGSALGAGTANAERNPWYTNAARDWNGGGHSFSEDYGFGGLDARSAVRLAESWTEIKTSANEDGRESVSAWAPGLTIAHNSTTTVTFGITSGVDIETVVVDLGLQHTFSGDLRITLTSPNGTVSTLLNRVGGPYDVNRLELTSNSFFGESSGGTWTLTIQDLAAGDVGTLTSASLNIFGSTSSDDDTYIYTNQYHTLASGFGRSTLDGGAGHDTLNAAAVSGASSINLVSVFDGGSDSSIGGTFLRIYGGIEDVVTGDGDDVINGNGVANWLRGMRGNDQLNGNAGDDKLEGGAGDDRLYGGADNDTIIGGTGSNTMVGDGGDDVVMVTGSFDSNDTAVGGAGNDTLSFELVGIGVSIDLTQTFAQFGFVFSEISYAEFENLTGSDGFDTLRGTNTNNVLIGLNGQDTIEGRGGNDVINGGLVSYANTRLIDGNDTIDAGTGHDRIIASLGADTVDGGDGIDTLDFAWVTNAVTANMTSGVATFFAGGSWSEPYSGEQGGWGSNNRVNFTNIEYLQGGSGGDVFTGNSAANRLYGNGGNDILNGAGGGDLMDGGFGDDTFYIDDEGDRIVDAGGTDLVNAYITHRLGAGIENLRFLGTAALTGTGNDLANLMIGNGAGDRLFGGGGADRLIGNEGHDVLDGGTEADRMEGGAGNDTYYVDTLADVIIEAAGAGLDTAYARASYTLGSAAQVETLRALNHAGVTLTGNGFNNTIIGGNGNDILRGAGGNDRLTGGLGADTFRFVTAADSSNDVRDRIEDFDRTEGDRIDLAGVFGGTLTFIGAGAFTGAGQVRVTQSGSTHYVQVNLSGDATPEMLIYVMNNPGPLAGTDFIL